MEISYDRWLKAQSKELENWKTIKDIISFETAEIKIKYSILLKKISKKIKFKNNWKILDIGCGATCISRYLPKAIKFGIDPLADKLNISKTKIGDVFVNQGRGEDLPFGNEIFNLVVCRNVLDHTNDPELILEETKRVLKKSGYFILSNYIYTDFIVFLKILSEYFGVRRNIEHPFSFSEKSLKSICINAGFNIIETKIVYEGTNSTDYGKPNKLDEDKSLINRFLIFVNNKIFKNDWFVKELMFVLQKNDK